MLVRRSRALLALLLAAVVVSAVGCLEGLDGLTGGASNGGGDASDGDSSIAASDATPGSDGTGGQEGGFEAAPPIDGGSDSGSPWSPSCPDTLPPTGSSCTDPSLQCEYGTATWSVSCDPVVQCDDAGTWEAYQPSTEPCTTKPGPNSTSCPANLAAASQAPSCQPLDLTCVYSQGECKCQTSQGGPVQLDSGASLEWVCLPEEGCPFPRPRLGSACAGSVEPGGQVCTYEACSYAQVCRNGVWQAQQAECAGAGFRAHEPE